MIERTKNPTKTIARDQTLIVGGRHPPRIDLPRPEIDRSLGKSTCRGRRSIWLGSLARRATEAAPLDGVQLRGARGGGAGGPGGGALEAAALGAVEGGVHRLRLLRVRAPFGARAPRPRVRRPRRLRRQQRLRALQRLPVAQSPSHPVSQSPSRPVAQSLSPSSIAAEKITLKHMFYRN
eukprot:152534-Prorocentrum_minimum.AAC.1